MKPIHSDMRRVFSAVLFFVCFAIASATALAAADLPKDIAARLATKWLADAKQIHTPEHVIYYHGSATGGIAPDGKHWAGAIEGEILLLTPTSAMACARLRLGPTGSIAVQGPSQTKLDDDAPPWKKLLGKPK